MALPRVAFLIPPKKQKKQEVLAFCSALEAVQIHNFFLDPDRPYEDQPHFDILIHKATDLVQEKEFNKEAQDRYHRLESYIESRPSLLVLDPIRCLTFAISRELTAQTLSSCLQGDLIASLPYSRIDTDQDDLVTLMSEAGISFPIICKSVLACGPQHSHLMAVVTKPVSVSDIPVSKPFIVQPFVNHGGKILKVYVMSDYSSVIEKKSIPDLDCSQGPAILPFNSQSFSDATFEELRLQKASTNVSLENRENAIQLLSNAIQKHTSMSIFGYDCIYDFAKNRIYIVDLNYFPSFNGVPERENRLTEWLLNKWRVHSAHLHKS
eukprot:TRINITY_DN8827_c0_g1_i2.p1 TRINITY_DN8827_c0_g1~~TRINITY_DN8827_c0_g1_i2.p1  ORF type:complete len:323 (-),score=54.34 TRINITY_DN8827_c0_g1_i2:37-1005(-)